jgi:carboxylesterase
MATVDLLLGSNGFIERKNPRTVVLLIHGLTGTPSEMKHLGRVISRKGISVACPELAGHCKSIQDLKKTQWQDWYQSVEKVFDALKEEFEHVFITGLSMGALMAMMIAAHRQSQLWFLG